MPQNRLEYLQGRLTVVVMVIGDEEDRRREQSRLGQRKETRRLPQAIIQIEFLLIEKEASHSDEVAVKCR